jgi:hypothetical protein
MLRLRNRRVQFCRSQKCWEGKKKGGVMEICICGYNWSTSDFDPDLERRNEKKNIARDNATRISDGRGLNGLDLEPNQIHYLLEKSNHHIPFIRERLTTLDGLIDSREALRIPITG